ncbi:MAG: hypothetical protein KGN79_13240 [Acidobacteriota bacterium]|nr:hypothetical protein [Acidobacteriota bacterium]
MSSNPQVDYWHRVYLLSAWRRSLYTVLGFVLFAAGLFFSLAMSASNGKFPAAISALFLLGTGIYLLSYGLRSRITLNGTRITVRGPFREQSADQSEIEGMRTYSDRSGTYTKLYLKEDRGSITFLNGFETDGDFDTWFRNIPNLDQRDRDAILDQVERDESLGSTPDERKAALRYAIAWAVLLHVLVIMAAAALNFGDESLQQGAALIVALTPIAVIALVWKSPLLYTVFRAKKDPRSELGFVLLIAGFALLIRCRGIHMVSLQNALALTALLTIILIAALFNTMRSGAAVWGRMIALVFALGMYGYGLIVVTDALSDHSSPTSYATMVVGKHISHGKSTSYILDLAPWGPVQDQNHISVTRRGYYAAQLRDPICFNLYPGVLHLAWYQVTPCTSQTYTAP